VRYPSAGPRRQIGGHAFVIANLFLSTLLMAVAVAPGGGVSKPSTNAHDFSRYQIILDRSPFSPKEGAADAPQPPFASRFSFIGTAQTNEEARVMAILQDKEANNRIYFKTEGETIGAVTVVSISQSPGAKVVLKQGLETATLSLETKATVGAPGSSAPAPAANPLLPGGQPMPGMPSPVRRIPFRRGG
jgi:hypothetical protein